MNISTVKYGTCGKIVIFDYFTPAALFLFRFCWSASHLIQNNQTRMTKTDLS